MKSATLILLFSLAGALVPSSGGAQLWVFPSGEGDDADVAAVAVSPDGGIVFVGTADQGKTVDMVVAKYDPSGKLLWSEVYDGPLQLDDEARDVLVDAQSNVYVLVREDFSNRDITSIGTVHKYSSTGTRLWRKELPALARTVAPSALAWTSNGMVAVTATVQWVPGSSAFGAGVLTGEGDIHWWTTVVPPSGLLAAATDLAVGDNNNVYVSGFARMQFGYDSAALLAFDPTGVLLWERYYNTENPGDNRFFRVATDDATGRVIAGGHGRRQEHHSGALVIQAYDQEGALLWDWWHDGSGGDMDYVADFVVTEGGYVHFTGRYVVENNARRMMAGRLRPGGTLEWLSIVSGPLHGNGESTALTIDDEGNTWVTGTTTVASMPGLSVAKFDRTGALEWLLQRGTDSYTKGIATSIARAPDGVVYAGGLVTRNRIEHLAIAKILEPEVLAPTDFAITRGLLVGGGLEQLLRSDDSRMSILALPYNEVAVASAEVVVSSVAQARTGSELIVRLEAAASASPVRQRLELFNYTLGAWVQIAEIDAATSDRYLEVAVTADVEEYIDPNSGRMDLRVGFHNRGVSEAAWVATLDFVQFVLIP